jgi:hypothetical protein
MSVDVDVTDPASWHIVRRREPRPARIGPPGDVPDQEGPPELPPADDDDDQADGDDGDPDF